MTKRSVLVLIVMVVLAAVAVQSVSAYGGTRIGFGVGTPNAVFIYRPSPFDFRVGYDFTEGNEFIFVSGDLRPIDNIHIAGPLHFSFGIGGYIKTFPEVENSEDMFELGTRLPFGLSLLFLDNVAELFFEVAPGFDLYPKPAFSDEPVQLWAGLTLAIR